MTLFLMRWLTLSTPVLPCNHESAPDDLKGSERDMIISALRDSNGNRKLASERLGISGRTLRYKLAKYKEQGIEIPVASVA